MKKFWMASVSAVALAAIASPAVAGNGYVSAGFGFATGWDDRDWTRDPPPGSGSPFSNGSQMFDAGSVFEGAVGYESGPLGNSEASVRVELQGTRINYDVDKVTFAPASSSPNGQRNGNLTETLFMVNVLVDFELSQLGITPYAGVGLGIAHGTLKSHIVGSGPPFLSFNDADDSGFVWQFIVGASAAVTPVLELYGNYRAVQLPEMTVSDVSTRGGPVTFDSDTTHLFTVGLRVNF